MGTRLRTEEVTYTTPPMPAPSIWPRASVPEYGPRVVRLTKAARIGVGITGTLAAGIALFGGLIVAHQAQQGNALLNEGKVISGQVARKQVRQSDGTKYRLTYRYRVGDEIVERTKNVRREFYEAHQEKGPIEVTVLSRKPSVHHLGRITKGDIDKDLAIGGILIVVMVGVFGGLAGLIRGIGQSEARILTDWTATSAQVLSRKKIYGGEHGTTYKLRIRYRVPRQAELEAEVKVSRSGKWDAEPGTFLDIFYNPEDVTKVRVREGMTTAEIDPSTY